MGELRIRAEREARDGWTQSYVGKMVGVSDKAIHLIETGQRKPSYDVMEKLEVLFGLSHNILFATESEPTEEDCFC